LKVLLIGLGSIGTRHLRNILQLGYQNVNVVSRKGFLPEEFSFCTCFVSVEEALQNENYDKAVICLPTAFHDEVLIQLLQAGIKNIYLEKPVSHQYQFI
jgi:predicted dehydrogenase